MALFGPSLTGTLSTQSVIQCLAASEGSGHLRVGEVPQEPCLLSAIPEGESFLV